MKELIKRRIHKDTQYAEANCCFEDCSKSVACQHVSPEMSCWELMTGSTDDKSSDDIVF